MISAIKVTEKYGELFVPDDSASTFHFLVGVICMIEDGERR